MLREINLPLTDNETMAQRISHRHVLAANQMLTVDMPCNYKALNLAIHDFVQVTNAELNWTNKVFMVQGWSLGGSGGINLVLQETESTAFADPSSYTARVAGSIITYAQPDTPPPSGLAATAEVGGIALAWNLPAAPDTWDMIEVHQSSTNDRSAAAKIATSKADEYFAELRKGETRYFWIRSINAGGTASSWHPESATAGVSATAIYPGRRFLEGSLAVADGDDGAWIRIFDSSGGTTADNWVSVWSDDNNTYSSFEISWDQTANKINVNILAVTDLLAQFRSLYNASAGGSFVFDVKLSNTDGDTIYAKVGPSDDVDMTTSMVMEKNPSTVGYSVAGEPVDVVDRMVGVQWTDALQFQAPDRGFVVQNASATPRNSINSAGHATFDITGWTATNYNQSLDTPASATERPDGWYSTDTTVAIPAYVDGDQDTMTLSAAGQVEVVNTAFAIEPNDRIKVQWRLKDSAGSGNTAKIYLNVYQGTLAQGSIAISHGATSGDSESKITQKNGTANETTHTFSSTGWEAGSTTIGLLGSSSPDFASVSILMDSTTQVEYLSAEKLTNPHLPKRVGVGMSPDVAATLYNPDHSAQVFAYDGTAGSSAFTAQSVDGSGSGASQNAEIYVDHGTAWGLQHWYSAAGLDFLIRSNATERFKIAAADGLVTIPGGLTVQGTLTTTGLSPGEQFSVTAAGNASILIDADDGNDNPAIKMNAPTGDSAYIDLTGEDVSGDYAARLITDQSNTTLHSSGVLLLAPTTSYVALQYAGANKLQSTSGGISVTGDVAATTGTYSGNVTVANLSVTSTNWLGFGDYGERVSGSNASGTLTFWTDATLALTLDNSQDATFSGTVTSASTSGDATFVAYRNQTTLPNSGAGANLIGAYLFKSSDTSGSEPHYAGIGGFADQYGRMELQFFTERDNWDSDPRVPTLTLDISKNATFAGNVGIGSGSTPFLGDTDIAFQVGSSSYDNPAIQIRSSSSGTGKLWFGDNSGSAAGRRDGFLEYSQTDQEMRFGAAQVERMRIDGFGNLGVGVTNPGSYYARDLVVTGPSEGGITIAATGEHTNYLLFADSTSGVARYAGMIGYAHAQDLMSFRTNSIERMVIASNGNVGIGAASPAQKLDISGGGLQILGNVSTPASGTSSVLIDYYSGAARYWARGADGSTRGSHNFYVLENDGGGQLTALSLDSSANATFSGGIEVAGVSNVQNTFTIGGSGFGTLTYGTIGSGSAFGIRSGSGKDLSIGSGGSWDVLRLSAAGAATFSGKITATAAGTNSSLYALDLSRSGSGSSPDIWGTSNNLVLGTSASAAALTINGTGATVANELYFDGGKRVGLELVGEAEATVGPGWMTVAAYTSGRQHGEIIVTDADSGDHGFIRIDWLHSYADSNFTVLNTGGHSNRITGCRVLYQTSNITYGTYILQVYVTTQSTYEVSVYHHHGTTDYGQFTVQTPVIADTITGYAVHGNQIEGLDSYSFASEEGIQAGGSCLINGRMSLKEGGEPYAYGTLLLEANSSSRQIRISPPSDAANGYIDYRGGNLLFKDDGTEVARFQGNTSFQLPRGYLEVGGSVASHGRIEVFGSSGAYIDLTANTAHGTDDYDARFIYSSDFAQITCKSGYLDLHPQTGKTYIRHAGSVVFETAIEGAIIRDVAGSDTLLRLNGSNNAALAYWYANTSYNSGQGRMFLYSYHNGALFQVIGEDNGGTSRTMFWADPDANSYLYYNGNWKARTLSDGFQINGSLSYYSDRRLKKDITPISGALDAVLSLKGVNFTLIDSDTKQIGFVAQDIQADAPSWLTERIVVEPDGDDDDESAKNDGSIQDGESVEMLAVNYANMVALLTEAMKEQQTQIEALSERIKELESK